MKYIILVLLLGIISCSNNNLEGEKVKELLDLEENEILVAKINTNFSKC